MPCAEKTTLARGLQEKLAAFAPTEVLDGDEMRKFLSPEPGFSRQDRALNVERLAQVARLLAKHGVAVMVACVSPYADMRSRAKEIARDANLAFLEVHVVAAPHILIARDTKELYARASAGRLPGVPADTRSLRSAGSSRHHDRHRNGVRGIERCPLTDLVAIPLSRHHASRR